MKQRLRDFVKYNKVLYTLYNKMGSALVRFIGLFMRINSRKILFISFGGRKYDDSPRAIYEEMIQRKEFENYTFVWAFVQPENELPGNPIIIKTDSLSYFYHALTSGFWITNTSAERNLRFKKKGNVCINTWHGTPLKKIYGEENAERKANDNKNKSVRKDKVKKFDLVCAQSPYDREIFSRIFNMDINDIIISDLPRNDTLLKASADDIKTFKEKLGIEINKKLYYICLHTESILEITVMRVIWHLQLICKSGKESSGSNMYY